MITALLLFQLILRYDSVLTVCFHSIQLRGMRLRCFEVDITVYNDDSESLRDYLRWLIRIVIVVVFCYVWQTCFISYKAFHLQPSSPSCYIRDIFDQCRRKADCFASSKPFYFFLSSWWHEPPQICDEGDYPTSTISLLLSDENKAYAALINRILPDKPFVVCVRFIHPNNVNYTTQLAISFALSKMIVLFTELTVWILLETKRFYLCNVTLLIITLLFFFIWITCMFIPTIFTFVVSWLGFVELLSIPLILLACRQIATHLRRLKSLKFNTWKLAADRSIDHLRGEEELLDLNYQQRAEPGSPEHQAAPPPWERQPISPLRHNNHHQTTTSHYPPTPSQRPTPTANNDGEAALQVSSANNSPIGKRRRRGTLQTKRKIFLPIRKRHYNNRTPIPTNTLP